MTRDEITGHVEFARMFADVIGYLHGNAVEDINRVSDAVESLAEMFYTHGAKHALEAAGGVASANGGEKAYQGVGKGLISTTEDIQRGWAENERKSKKRVYEDG
jgi:hypothetical protein